MDIEDRRYRYWRDIDIGEAAPQPPPHPLPLRLFPFTPTPQKGPLYYIYIYIYIISHRAVDVLGDEEVCDVVGRRALQLHPPVHARAQVHAANIYLYIYIYIYNIYMRRRFLQLARQHAHKSRHATPRRASHPTADIVVKPQLWSNRGYGQTMARSNRGYGQTMTWSNQVMV